MDTTTIAPLTATSLLTARGWNTGHTEYLEGHAPGEWIERTFYVPVDTDAAALRKLMGQLPKFPVVAY